MEDSGNIATTNAEIVVSFHYLGRENRGIMIATAFLNLLHINPQGTEESGSIEAESRVFRETHPLVSEGFIITYTAGSGMEQKHHEFQNWLNQAIAIGLAEWERQL
jgi:hypothetical protein